MRFSNPPKRLFLLKITRMKKIFVMFAVFMLICGCDDGDMTFKTFDFGATDAQPCGEGSNTYIKTNKSEAMILTLASSVLVNIPTPKDPATGADVPREVILGTGGNSITYRNYDANVSSSAICTSPAPATPKVVEEWSGSGTLSIITTELRDEGNRVTGFSHQVTLKSVSFDRNGETITINDNLFGSIKKPYGFTFDFLETETGLPTVYACDNGLVYNRKGPLALILSLPDSTFANEAGNKTIDLGGIGNDNEVIFRVFEGSISAAHICDDIPPLTPQVSQHWEAESGQLVINTIFEDGLYKHEVRLVNVVFSNSADETLVLYSVAPVEDEAEGYLFGTHTTAP